MTKNYKVIAIKRETYTELMRYVGKETQKKRKRVTYSDAVQELLSETKNGNTNKRGTAKDSGSS